MKKAGPSRETKRRAKAAQAAAAVVSTISAQDLARMGGGQLAYIKMMTPDQARAMFPALEGLPQGINLYALHAADGTPIALTDSRSAAVGHAMGDELAIASLH